jgi:rubrerythrin
MRSRLTRHLTSLREGPEAAPGPAVEALTEAAPARRARQARQESGEEFSSLRSAIAFRELRSEAPVPEAMLETAARPAPFELPPEFTWHDYTVFLLHIGAEIEHALMVQYLYAAWSLGGPQVPDNAEDRKRVQSWQTVILGIAKEEMGHLITVQNLLRLIGGPLNFEREDYPFRSDFYPFNFTLERLTLDSLAKYVIAESPEDWSGPEADAIRKRAASANQGDVTPVGKLYGQIIQLFESTRPAYLKERDFEARSLAYQASWDEWGRGYRDGQRGSSGPERHSPDLLILPAASRDQAVAALKAVAEQGEALVHEADQEESHFERFRRIYRELEAVSWEPSRPVARNPKTEGRSSTDAEVATEASAADTDLSCDVITDVEAIGWAHLFNLRYRLLLVDLMHALEVSGPTLQGEDLTPRGSLVNWTFGEMYNLRAIGGILVQRPLRRDGDPRVHAAGPPFEMPYTLSLPHRPGDRWRLHRDLLEASGFEIKALLGLGTAHADYLRALADADRQARRQIEILIASDRERSAR